MCDCLKCGADWCVDDGENISCAECGTYSKESLKIEANYDDGWW